MLVSVVTDRWRLIDGLAAESELAGQEYPAVLVEAADRGWNGVETGDWWNGVETGDCWNGVETGDCWNGVETGGGRWEVVAFQRVEVSQYEAVEVAGEYIQRHHMIHTTVSERHDTPYQWSVCLRCILIQCSSSCSSVVTLLC